MKTYLSLNSELDPDYNYYHKLLNYVDQCSYYQVIKRFFLVGPCTTAQLLVTVHTQTVTTDTFSHKRNFVAFGQDVKDCRRYTKDLKETEQYPCTPKNKCKPTIVPQRQETTSTKRG